ncbi:hypothetical protein I7I50_04006 [Histoplasma capsulatum G186AR]|uniref:Uncharacterized protein n=1 Tax=Ajellomyces capsulatus TaxID=5037 RepID=A0A8H7YM05_AJECA|nr:hypothetical protein I7I52_04914 [Histoplasma capsulatum]QSS75012.1 hypothetical protein I7I50_04006 [Histoplasma capsulatum G186AR]
MRGNPEQQEEESSDILSVLQRMYSAWNSTMLARRYDSRLGLVVSTRIIFLVDQHVVRKWGRRKIALCRQARGFVVREEELWQLGPRE